MESAELSLVLGVACELLAFVATPLPVSVLRRHGVTLLTLAGVMGVLVLCFYAFGGNRWQTHDSSHAFYVVALPFEILVAAIPRLLRERPQLLRLMAAFVCVTWPLLWYGAVLFASN